MAQAKKATKVVEISAADRLKALKAEVKAIQELQKAEAEQKKIERQEQRKALLKNGEMPPREGTVSAEIWAVCATYREEHGVSPSSTFVKEALPDHNTHTVQTQTARFRKYVGDVGQTAVVNDPFAPKPEEA